MEGFDYLGAGDGLSNYYVTFRVKHIDAEKLKSKLGGGTGTMASAGLNIVDAAPKAALDIAVPIIVGQVKKYGVDAEVTVSSVPPSKGGKSISEFFPGLVIGIGIGGASLAIVKLIAALIAKLRS